MKNNKLIAIVEKIFGCVGIIMILIESYAVLARNVLQVSTPWVDELLKLMFVWSIYICSALAFWSDDLISLTLIEDNYKESKPAVYGALKVVQYVLAMIISCLLVTQLFTIVQTQMGTGEATTVLKYPLWIMNLGMLLGIVMIVVFGVLKLIGCRKYFTKK